MNNSGWISLHRKILDWEWYGDLNVRVLFIHCLLKANHKDKKWRGEVIKRGSFITSLSNLSDEVSLSIQQTRTALNKLESTQEITRSRGGINTCISITNYEDYQDRNTTSNSEITEHQHAEQHSNNKSVTTTNNDNNIINKYRPSENGRTDGVSEDNSEEEKSSSKSSTVRVTEEMCERVYQEYPRKEKKQRGLKAIKKAIKQLAREYDLSAAETVEALVKKVKLYAKAKEGKEKQYIPLPATWFNGEEYKDPPESWFEGNQPVQQQSDLTPEERLSKEEAMALAEKRHIDFGPAHFTKISNEPEEYVLN